jgi:hypothetical protein
MNRFACLLLGTILFHVGAVSTRAQQGSPEQELIRLEKQWAEAVVKGDNSFFDRTAADDYVIVDAGGDVRHKQQERVTLRRFRGMNRRSPPMGNSSGFPKCRCIA